MTMQTLESLYFKGFEPSIQGNTLSIEGKKIDLPFEPDFAEIFHDEKPFILLEREGRLLLLDEKGEFLVDEQIFPKTHFRVYTFAFNHVITHDGETLYHANYTEGHFVLDKVQFNVKCSPLFGHATSRNLFFFVHEDMNGLEAWYATKHTTQSFTVQIPRGYKYAEDFEAAYEQSGLDIWDRDGDPEIEISFGLEQKVKFEQKAGEQDNALRLV